MVDVIRHYTLGDIYAVVRQKLGQSDTDKVMDGFVLKSRPPRPFNKYDVGFQDGVPKTMESEAYTVGTTEDGTMTHLYTLDQVKIAMQAWGFNEETVGHISGELESYGPHASLMGWGLAESLGVVNKTIPEEDKSLFYSMGDISLALQDAGMSNDVVNEILDNIEENKNLRLNVERIRVDDIPFNYKGLKMRFPSAEIPTWMTFTDYKTFHNENGIQKAILVLDGQAFICDGDVYVDFDKRKQEIVD